MVKDIVIIFIKKSVEFFFFLINRYKLMCLFNLNVYIVYICVIVVIYYYINCKIMNYGIFVCLFKIWYKMCK